MTPDEYLERIFSDAYKRESDQDENVARSLPFFAAALTLLATTLGLVRPAIPPFEVAAYPLVAYAALLGIGITVVLVLCFLLVAVRPRRFAYLASEAELRRYADDLRSFYQHAEAGAEAIDDAVVADVRKLLLDQYAAAAMQNRANNMARMLARTRATTALVIALFCAFALIGAILMQEIAAKGNGGDEGGQQGDRRGATVGGDPRQGDRSDPPQAGTAADAVRDQRRLGGEGAAEADAAAGGETMTEKPQPGGAPTPANPNVPPSAPAAPAPAKPAPPPMQNFQKGENGGLKR